MMLHMALHQSLYVLLGMHQRLCVTLSRKQNSEAFLCFRLFLVQFVPFLGEKTKDLRKVWIHTCPQELGQPVQWILTASGMSSCCSSFSTTAMALFLVSMIATPQN